jgi:hypothetical protein
LARLNAGSGGGGSQIAEKAAAFLGKAGFGRPNPLKAHRESIMVDRGRAFLAATKRPI